MKDLVVRAYPILPERAAELERLAQTLQAERVSEVQDFFRRMGVARETWHVQETPQGPWAICVTQLAGADQTHTASLYSASEQAFDRWYKSQVQLITGINPDRDPLGPPTSCVFDSAASLAQ